MWNDQCVLVKAVHSKFQQHQHSPILAGVAPSNRSSQVSTASSSSLPQLKHDPWASFVPTSQPSFPTSWKANTVTQPAAQRQIDAPTETKFKQQNERISELQSQFDDLKAKVIQRDEQSQAFEKRVDGEFQLVRKEIATQVGQMSQNFQHSLETALQRQDAQMNTSFDELKQMLRQSQMPNPQKKAKAKHPEGKEDDDMDQF